jgi:hypothetical protein
MAGHNYQNDRHNICPSQIESANVDQERTSIDGNSLVPRAHSGFLKETSAGMNLARA